MIKARERQVPELENGGTLFTVSVIGPDGAGKSKLLEELPSVLSMPVKRIYMGMRFESSDTLLPTTRLLLAYRRALGVVSVPRHGAPRDQVRPRRGLRAVAQQLRSALLLLNLFAEEWYRQALAWIYQRRGYLVLFDRHFVADFYAFDQADTSPGRPPGTRLHGFLLKWFYPRPDVVIYLAAPAEVFLERKGEGTPERIERMQQGYLQFGAQIEHFVCVNASKPQEEVLHEVAGIIRRLYARDGRARTRETFPES